MSNYQWYILSVRGGREAKIIEKIKSELKKRRWDDLVKELKVISDNNKKNILKGYIISNCSLTPELVTSFYKIPEIMAFLNHQRGDKNLPFPVSQIMIDNLLSKTEEKKVKRNEIQGSNLNIGDLVKITDGIFANREGKITYLDKKKQKVKIIVESSGWEVNDVPINICQKVIN